jgi:very-short-patch-repair endonuclease
LFGWYVENQWAPWATAETHRRKVIRRYNDLFSLQQTISTDGSETQLELVWGLGYAVWQREGFTTVLKHPLVSQPCEVILNEKNFDLEVCPRNIDPRIEVDAYVEMEIPGVRQLDAFWKSALENGANRPNPFEGSTYEGVLKAAVGHLDPSGAYEVLTDDPSPPPPGEKLRITNTWVLFARKRTGGPFLEDVERLKKRVEITGKLPAVVRNLVQRAGMVIQEQSATIFRGLSTSDGSNGSSDTSELYFPMAYNDEQVSVIQKLEHGNGVVVQGPPGTGKTHTIANIICHYLAQGKRVLVTSRGESALTEVIGKLPEQIRPLCVGLLSDESDGMKKFEHSIQTIASNISATNVSRANAEIRLLQERLEQLHAKISYVDQQVSAYAAHHMRTYTFQGQEVTAEEMAKLVITQGNEHQWMDDELPERKDSHLPFGEDDIRALRRARITIGKDLVYLNCSIPSPDEFPSWAELVELHRDLGLAKAIEADLALGAVLNFKDSSSDTFAAAKSLSAFLDERRALKKKLLQVNDPALERIAKKLASMRSDDPLLLHLLQSCAEIRNIDSRRMDLLSRAIFIPVDAEVNEDFLEAVSRLSDGKSAFSLPFGKGEARRLLAETTMLGAVPATVRGWEGVQSLLDWREAAKRCVSRWNAIAREFGIQTQYGSVDEACRELGVLQGSIENAHRLIFTYDGRLYEKIESVYGKKVAERMSDDADATLKTVEHSLHAHVDKGRLAYAVSRAAEVTKKLDNRTGAVVEQLRTFLTELLGNEEQDEVGLRNTWVEIQSDLARILSLRPSLDELTRVTALIEAAGAKNWAARLRTEPPRLDSDPITPASWREAWNWRCASNFLEKIDGRQKLQELFAQRKTLTTSLARTYQNLIAEKTWLGVFHNSPPAIRQALQAYLNSIQAMGAGTGVRAIRHRRSAREAMLSAYRAVPCWVMPEWRICETIPSELGLFDLVVIDEASQSDIWALPALLRGEKLLVVGDHKQVSPSAIGVPEEKIKELRDRFLINQPFGTEMTPDKSIYDLARVIFAGSSVMLREHFRCVPAIIEYSNREFYEGDVKPLRLPHASERLNPPLIDVFVKGGHRDGDVNAAEAKAIVDEIDLILADPDTAGRSIGVVTLLGTKQAAHIHELVNRRISPVEVVSRRISVGPPSVFQGRERDIMLLSMVLGPGDRGAANRSDMQQRFNVALSRARDRMYLFRSVEQNAFAEETLSGAILRHFKQPFRQDAQKTKVLRDRCESGFELEMFDELVKRGFRVDPQVHCGGFKIDFVVEGREGRRLAIECDGDRFHGPGQWSDDMARQRVLERAGWTFWRCFASSWARRKSDVLSDLLRTLTDHGIEPLGAKSVDIDSWVLYKEVDPFSVAEGTSGVN